MSMIQQDPESSQNPELLKLDENGEVIVNDPNIAKRSEELSDAELEDVAGGCTANNCPRLTE
ncbi:MAG: type A2 lantipeptide [Gemmatimonadaceae bacterium]|nr:type A2 lantipeptide [Gloeobacterales cyanobacterium ES-bin-141]